MYPEGILNLSAFKDSISGHVWKVSPDALHLAVEHIERRMECVVWSLNGTME